MMASVPPDAICGDLTWKSIVLHDYLARISLLEFLGLLFVGLFAAAVVGEWLGRRSRDRGAVDKDAGTLATASLGLLALLIAFTYSLSLQRYDLRRQSILEEANAIGSAANYALMLPEAQKTPMLALLRQYAKSRIGLGAPYDPDKFARDVEEATRLQGAMWQQAVAAAAAQPQSLPVYQFTSNLNEVNNIGEKRLTALRNHTPTIVVLALVATALVAMGFTGYAAGSQGTRRRTGTLIIAFLLALLIMLTVDLDRPERGTIEVSPQALVDALNAIPGS